MMLSVLLLSTKARTGRFLEGKPTSGHGLLCSHKGQQGAANEQASWDVFQGCALDFGRLDAGSCAGFTS